MSTRVDPALLRHTRMFHNFSDQEISELLEACDDEVHEQGEAIISAGETDRALHLIVSGTAQVELPSPVFDETPVMNLETGDAFGESSFFHPASHGVTVRCLTPVQTLRFPRMAYDALLARGSLAAYKLGANAAEILGARLQEMDRWLVEMIQEQQNARIRERWRAFREEHAHIFHLTGVIRPAATMG